MASRRRSAHSTLTTRAGDADIVVTNGVDIAVERAMYWNAGGVFWSGGTIAAGTRMPPPPED
jgi:hypothetical protein